MHSSLSILSHNYYIDCDNGYSVGAIGWRVVFNFCVHELNIMSKANDRVYKVSFYYMFIISECGCVGWHIIINHMNIDSRASLEMFVHY